MSSIWSKVSNLSQTIRCLNPVWADSYKCHITLPSDDNPFPYWHGGVNGSDWLVVISNCITSWEVEDKHHRFTPPQIYSFASEPCIVNVPAGSPLSSDHSTNRTSPGLHSNVWTPPALPCTSFLASGLASVSLHIPYYLILSRSRGRPFLSNSPHLLPSVLSGLSPPLGSSSAHHLMASTLQPVISFCPWLCPLHWSPATFITSKTIKQSTQQ